MARGWEWGEPCWKLGDSEVFNLQTSCWDLIYSLLCSRKSFNPGSGRAGWGGGAGGGGGGRMVFPSETPEPGSTAPSLQGKEGDSGILWGPP